MVSDGRGVIVIVDPNDFDACTKDRTQIPGTIEGNTRLEGSDIDLDDRGKLAGRITSNLGTYWGERLK